MWNLLQRILASLTSGVAVALIALSTWISAPQGTKADVLLMAVGTTLEASGFLTHLLPKFTEATGVAVRPLAVGTGRALELGRRGDVDLLFVHHPDAEQAFVAEGWATIRRPIMTNRFVLVGPEALTQSPPSSLVQAFQALSRGKHLFLSRGDDSGTHAAERVLWPENDAPTSSEWYRETGQGMGRTLGMAAELGAFTLADSASWATLKRKQGLRIVAQSPAQANVYSLLVVAESRHPTVNHAAATQFLAWVGSADGRAAIESFQLNGQALFDLAPLN